MMINGIMGAGVSTPHVYQNPKNVKTNFANAAEKNGRFNEFSNFSSNAIKNYNFKLANTISFGASLNAAITKYTSDMTTCGDEYVGEVVDINRLLFATQSDRIQAEDTAKTTTKIGDRFIRNQARAIGENTIRDTQDVVFEMAVRDDDAKTIDAKSKQLLQKIDVHLTPVNHRGEGTHERVFVVNTKGNKGDNFVAVVEDNDNVLMTNAGAIIKSNSKNGILGITAEQTKVDADGKVKNEFTPFTVEKPEFIFHEPKESIGEGSEIVIGMEKGRFVNELKDSIKTFVEKINNGEIVLQQFVAAPNAKDTQLVMLAGGFGSRAEYTNASSDAILHGDKDGAISTKGAFRTVTGLTPMETTFVTLHNAGLLDCSKMEIGNNIKFYQNEDVNRGNGGYSVGLVNKMKRDDRKQVMIFPNDSMSRMTNAVIEANKIISDGNAAIVMIAKEVPSEDARGNFGIMKLGPQNEILEFAEKPKVIPEGYEHDGQCLTNTFQFAVSNEAFEVLEMFEPFFSKSDKNKETRDWAKQYIPIIKTISQDDDVEVIKDKLAAVFNVTKEELEDNRHDINKTIAKAKEVLGDQKLVAVPTDEPWADCGTLNALYDTSMKIVSGTFQLEDFERAHAMACVDTLTGLIASSPEQLKEIQDKYVTNGQVMVVEKAKKVNDEDVADIPVTINERK